MYLLLYSLWDIISQINIEAIIAKYVVTPAFQKALFNIEGSQIIIKYIIDNNINQIIVFIIKFFIIIF